MSHEWGNYPQNFTPKMYWGARAILERESDRPGKALYLVSDRQSFEQLDGSRMDPNVFLDWINTKVLPELRRFARENRFYMWSDLVTIQSEEGSFMCQATPKNSGGEYLYIGCWELEQPPTIMLSQLQQSHTLNDRTAFGPGQDCDKEGDKVQYTLIMEEGPCALILCGEGMTQYAVVHGLDKETGNWDWTCCCYDFGKFSALTKAEALFKALDYYLMWTNEKHISWARMSEIAAVLKDGLLEDGIEEACRYMADVAELSDSEAEYFGLDMEQYRDAAPSSTGSDYSPSNPWNAPGMSVSDFI